MASYREVGEGAQELLRRAKRLAGGEIELGRFMLLVAAASLGDTRERFLAVAAEAYDDLRGDAAE